MGRGYLLEQGQLRSGYAPEGMTTPSTPHPPPPTPTPPPASPQLPVVPQEEVGASCHFPSLGWNAVGPDPVLVSIAAVHS